MMVCDGKMFTPGSVARSREERHEANQREDRPGKMKHNPGASPEAMNHFSQAGVLVSLLSTRNLERTLRRMVAHHRGGVRPTSFIFHRSDRLRMLYASRGAGGSCPKEHGRTFSEEIGVLPGSTQTMHKRHPQAPGPNHQTWRKEQQAILFPKPNGLNQGERGTTTLAGNSITLVPMGSTQASSYAYEQDLVSCLTPPRASFSSEEGKDHDASRDLTTGAVK